MDNLPLVSIGIINYNNEPFVLETLESIKAQDYPHIELIIVDDCSSDNSLLLIKEWIANYAGKWKLITHEKNKGVCAACNTAIKNASGKYFSYIATDDLILPYKISLQVKLLENSGDDVAAVYSDAYLINKDSSSRYGWFIQSCRPFAAVPSGNIYDALLLGNYIPGMSVLIKKHCLNDIGLFDESLQYEDYDMWLRIAKKYNFLFSDYVSVKYRTG